MHVLVTVANAVTGTLVFCGFSRKKNEKKKIKALAHYWLAGVLCEGRQEGLAEGVWRVSEEGLGTLRTSRGLKKRTRRSVDDR